MSTRISKVVAGCFAILRQLRSIQRSLTEATLTRLVVSLVLTHVDYCNSVLTGLPLSQLNRLGSHQCCGSSHPLWTSMWPHYSTAHAASLVACPWEDWVQTVRAGVSLPTWHGSRIPGPQLPMRFRRHDTATSTFGGNITTGRTRHPLSNTRWPDVPCHHCTRLECSSTLSVICIDTSYFSTTVKDTSIPS